MKPNLFHRCTSLILIAALLGTTFPAPLLAQQAFLPEPAPILTDRPLSLPPAGPQPEARLLREQEAMLAKLAADSLAMPPAPPETAAPGPREPQRPLPVFPKFSDPPADAEIAMIQLFATPAFPFGAEKPGENAALVRALEKWERTGRMRGDFGALEEFMGAHPGTRWEVALRREIARLHLRGGFFTRAVTALERAWEAARTAEQSPQREIADGIAAELAELDAQLGREAQLTALLAATKDRPLADHLADRLRHSRMRFGADAVRGRGGAGNCGASALVHLLAEARPKAPETPILKDSEKLLRLGLVPGPQGYSLRQLGALADAAGFPLRAIRRDSARGPEWPVPSIIHWTRGHYSALIKRAGSQYLVRDLSLGGDRYVSAAALREEASGYALVKDKPLPKGWKDAPPAESETIFGATTGDNSENPDCPYEKGTGDGKKCCGMPGFDFLLYKGALRITDTPIAYTPARGPEMAFTLTYNHLDPHSAAGATYGNFGSNWSWSGPSTSGLAYVEIAENGTDANVYLPGGVVEKYEDVLGAPPTFDYTWSCLAPSPLPPGHSIDQYTATETFATHDDDAAPFTEQENFYSHATLRRTSAPAYALSIQPGWPDLGAGTENLTGTVVAWADGIGYDPDYKHYCGRASALWAPPLTLFKRVQPVVYERVLKDGTRQVFDRHVGNRYFLTRVIQPDGSVVDVIYNDNSNQLDYINDATGTRFTLLYQNEDFPQLITKVTDPFGRFATFEYDLRGRLTAITDAAGMRSSFEYRFNSTFIQKMTTPYGDTTFTYSRPDTGIRALEATDPLGGRQRLELHLGSAETRYWDQRAMKETGNAAPNPADAHIYAWAYSSAAGSLIRPILVSEKHPLENVIIYTYEGQTPENPGVAGTNPNPKTITRKVPNPVPNALPAEVDQITQYEYDALGHITKVTDPKERITAYTYSGDHLTLVKQFSNEGGTPHYDVLAEYLNYHTVSHQPQQVKDAAGQITDYTYDATYGRIQSVIRHRTVNGAAVNETTTYTYAGLGGRLSRITGPVAGSKTDYGYDSVGRVNSVTNSEDYTVTHLFDALDRRVKTTYPDGTYEQTIYSLLDAEWQRDRAGRWTRTVHDANREVESVTDPAGRTVQFQHCDGCGALEGIVDGEGNRTSFAFDVAGRLTRKEYADGTGLDYEYEAGTSRLKQMTDAKHQVTHFRYDVDNTLAAVSYTTEAGQPLVPPTPGVSYVYDADYKRLKTMSDQFGDTRFRYWPVKKTVDAGNAILTQLTDARGAGRLRYEDGPEGTANEGEDAADIDKIIHSYDEYGRELSSALNGVAEARTYDALGRVTTVVNPLGTFTNTYASAVSGRVAQVLYPGGHKAEYGYHPILPGANPAALGNGDLRLSRIKNTRMQSYYYGYSYAQVASQFNYDYDKAGNIVNWYQRGNDPSGQLGQVWQLGYDAADQLIGAALKTAYLYDTPSIYDNTIQQQQGYSYDRAGNRVTEQSAVRQSNGSYAVTLTSATHNVLNQVTSRTGGSGAMILEGTVNEPATVSVGGQPAQVWGIGNGQYAFRGSAPVAAGANSVPIVARDASYNGSTQQNINEHQTTRNAQVQASGVAIPSLAYDDNGNLITETRANGTVRTFHWDAMNRLVKIVDGATTTEWKYSGRGQRMEEKVNNVVTAKWRWDGLQMKEMLAGTTLRRYYGMGMQWTANTAQPAVTANYYFFRDHLGSLREMIDASGNLHKRYAYDLWGRRTQTTNTTTVPEPMLGFTGHFYHASTGLHLAFYRAYSAELGRWLNRDPLKNAEILPEGPNLYSYVANSPIRLTDRLGLLCLCKSLKFWTQDGAPIFVWDVMDIADEAERRNGVDAGTGRVRHCVAACLIQRHFGSLGGFNARDLWDQFHEDPNTEESRRDMQAEDVGEALACSANESCESACLKHFGRNPQ